MPTRFFLSRNLQNPLSLHISVMVGLCRLSERLFSLSPVLSAKIFHESRNLMPAITELIINITGEQLFFVVISMLISAYVGVSCSSSWIKAVQVEWKGRTLKDLQAHVVPLPVGCINERSGTIEDSRQIHRILQGMVCLRPHPFRICQVHVSVPRACSFTTSWRIEGLGRPLKLDEIQERYAHELPGRRDTLCIDAHQRVDPVDGSVRVMLVAVKREALEGYRRLFAGRRRLVVSVTTDEIARYNLALQIDRSIHEQRVLVLWLSRDLAEISTWDRGILVDGQVLGSPLAIPMEGIPATWQKAPGSQADQHTGKVITAVQGLVAQAASSGQPIERIVICGPMRGDQDTRTVIESVLSVQSRVTWLELPKSDSGPDCAPPGGNEITNGHFDEALGAVLPRTKKALRDERRAVSHRGVSYRASSAPHGS